MLPEHNKQDITENINLLHLLVAKDVIWSDARLASVGAFAPKYALSH